MKREGIKSIHRNLKRSSGDFNNSSIWKLVDHTQDIETAKTQEPIRSFPGEGKLIDNVWSEQEYPTGGRCICAKKQVNTSFVL